MNAKLRLTVAAAVLALASPALATNGMRMIGFGPVQGSMGGVSVGAPLDSAVSITNPAGLTAVPSQANFGATYFKPDVEGSLTIVPFSMTTSLDSQRPASPIPAVGVVSRLNGLTFGLGMWGIAGMGVDYPDLMTSGPALSSVSLMRFTPSLGYKLNDVLAVGVTLNGMWGQMEYNTAGTGPHSGASAFGVGAVVGVYLTPVKQLGLGLAYETKSVFQDYVFQVQGGEDKLEFDQPATATIGAGYRPVEALLLAADVQWINWSDTQGEGYPKFSTATTPAAQGGWNMDWSDQWVVKVGAELQVTKPVKVRAGYAYGEQPLTEGRVMENALFPAIAEHHITGGLGIDLGEKWGINVSGMYAPESTVEGSGSVPDGAGGAFPVAYEVKMSQWDVSVGLTFKL